MESDEPILCKQCLSEGPHETAILTAGPHYASLKCGNCHAWIQFIRKPETPKNRRPASHRDLVQKFGRGFCELCEIPQGELPPGEALEGHHVIEFSDGGEASRDNTWILCTACHKLVNWRRIYVGHQRLLVKSWKDKLT